MATRAYTWITADEIKAVNWSRINLEDLAEIKKAIEIEQESRESRRFNELVNDVVVALATLKHEFPTAHCEIPINFTCEYCDRSDSRTVDILRDYISEEKFYLG